MLMIFNVIQLPKCKDRNKNKTHSGRQLRLSSEAVQLEFTRFGTNAPNTTVMEDGNASAESCVCSGITNQNLWLQCEGYL